MDPERIDEVESSITREEIRQLIHDKVIKALPDKGVSRARAKLLRQKKKLGRRLGPGSRTGTRSARVTKKEAWMAKIRSIRKRLRELKAKRVITESNYRQLYTMASSGRFQSVADLERYIKAHDMWRKR